MQTKLLKMVFEKALLEGAPDTRNGLSTHISKALEEDFGFSISARALSNYHQKLESNETLKISKDILDALSKYRGDKNFKEFIKAQKGKITSIFRSRYLIILLLIVIGFFVYDTTRKKCMQWEEDHYVKVYCEELNDGPIDIGLLNNFRKLEAKCNWTFFFNPDGSPKVWYYKRGDKDLELFTLPWRHPLNGKDLNKINVDMIRKHICPDFKGN